MILKNISLLRHILILFPFFLAFYIFFTNHQTFTLQSLPRLINPPEFSSVSPEVANVLSLLYLTAIIITPLLALVSLWLSVKNKLSALITIYPLLITILILGVAIISNFTSFLLTEMSFDSTILQLNKCSQDLSLCQSKWLK